MLNITLVQLIIGVVIANIIYSIVWLGCILGYNYIKNKIELKKFRESLKDWDEEENEE